MKYEELKAVGNRIIKGPMGGQIGFPFLNETHKRIYWFCISHPKLFPFKDTSTPYWLESWYFKIMRRFYNV